MKLPELVAVNPRSVIWPLEFDLKEPIDRQDPLTRTWAFIFFFFGTPLMRILVGVFLIRPSLRALLDFVVAFVMLPKRVPGGSSAGAR